MYQIEAISKDGDRCNSDKRRARNDSNFWGRILEMSEALDRRHVSVRYKLTVSETIR